MKKKLVLVASSFLFLLSTKSNSISSYSFSCEECKKKASQCIDDNGYNSCLGMIAKCNEICRKVYDVNYSDQRFTVEQQDKKPIQKDSNNNIEIFGTSSITVSVIKLKQCGMEKMPGLQIWYKQKIKSGFGICYNKINYSTMIMERNHIKELDLGDDYHYLSYDKETEITTYIIKSKKKYQLKITLRVPEEKKLITKFFDFPFEILPYEKRTPTVQQILKQLYKKEEIDKFRIEDLEGTRWSVNVKKIKNNANQEPSLMFTIFAGNIRNIIYVSINDMESGKNEVISEIEIPSKEWGPGVQKIIISISDKRTRLSLYTKTAGIPLIRDYNSSELIPNDK